MLKYRLGEMFYLGRGVDEDRTELECLEEIEREYEKFMHCVDDRQ